MEGLLTLGIMITMILISIPVAFAMIATSILVYVLAAHIPLGGSRAEYVFQHAILLLFGGTLLHPGRKRNGAGKRAPQMLEIAEAFVGFIPSGMAIAMVIACALFGTITGSDLATLAAIGGVMYPALVARGWPRSFVAGILGPSALLGMLIPPTIPGLIYALVTEVSVLKVFLSGVFPGIIIVSLFAIYIYYKGRKFFPDQKFQRPDFLRMARALKDGMPALGLPAIIFGGVYGGIFTVTEAAA